MRRLAIGLGVSLSIAAALFACGAARLPAPPYTRHPTEALQIVDFPPPPARVEFIPGQPPDPAVWIDGEWTWQGGRYAWKPGRWVVPPTGAQFAPWTSQRDRMGLYYIAEGKWRDAQGRELPDPKPISTGRTRGGPVTGPEGEAVPSAPNVPPATPPESEEKKRDGGPPETPSGATPPGTEPKTGPMPADSGISSDAGGEADGASGGGGAQERPSRESSPRMVGP
jgi:hypothetical protein